MILTQMANPLDGTSQQNVQQILSWTNPAEVIVDAIVAIVRELGG
jgi:hypothetical protein